MIGTSIQIQPFGLGAGAGRPRLARHALRLSARSRDDSSWWSCVTDLACAGRRLSIAILVLSFLVGTVICGPAARQALESGASVSAQAVELVAQTAPVEHGAPIKSRLPGLCTGHCVAHSLTLPAQFIQTVISFARRTDWLIVDDQWSQASRPERLERPPRG